MHVVVMGVSATGKTTVAVPLAEELGCEFVEGDDLHPRQNIEKMEHGIPLTDEDRWPWLDALHQAITSWVASGACTVLACSALKHVYRDRLIGALDAQVAVAYLRISQDEVAHRLQQRVGHYMPPSLLQSQFQALEEPGADEALVADAARPVPQVVDWIVSALKPGQ